MGCQHLKTRRFHIKVQISGFTLRIPKIWQLWVHITPWQQAGAELHCPFQMEGAHAEGCVHAEGRVPAGLLHLLATWADPEVCIFMTPILLLICSCLYLLPLRKRDHLAASSRRQHGAAGVLDWWLVRRQNTIITIFKSNRAKKQK